MATETIANNRIAPLHPMPPVSALHEDVNRVVRNVYDAGFKKGEAVGEARARSAGPHRSDRWLGVGFIFGFAAGVTVTCVVIGSILPAGAL